MGTTLRAELSEKNPYWMEKHRYYELKHFCLQYPIWKKAYAALDGTNTKTMNLAMRVITNNIDDPTSRYAIYISTKQPDSLCNQSLLLVEM